eukprot:UN10541
MCHRINNKFSIDMRHLFTFQNLVSIELGFLLNYSYLVCAFDD